MVVRKADEQMCINHFCCETGSKDVKDYICEIASNEHLDTNKLKQV